MKKEITKDDFRRVLAAVFPWGYSGNIEKWDRDWFLGWCYIDENSHCRDVMCINIDADTIVFWLIRYDEVSMEQVQGAIDGIMHVVMPGMKSKDIFGLNNKVISYCFSNDY